MSDFKAEAKDFAKGETPKLPVKLCGKVWHKGWDIPSYWAIDADGVPYADYGAHGCSMTKTTFDDLIKHMESSDDVTAAVIRKMAGRKQALPAWMNTALAQGWTPPTTFKREDYE